jgi:hypothetical protein
MDWSMIDLNKKHITIPLNVATIGEEGRIPIYDNLLERLTPNSSRGVRGTRTHCVSRFVLTTTVDR